MSDEGYDVVACTVAEQDAISIAPQFNSLIVAYRADNQSRGVFVYNNSQRSLQDNIDASTLQDLITRYDLATNTEICSSLFGGSVDTLLSTGNHIELKRS